MPDTLTAAEAEEARLEAAARAAQPAPPPPAEPAAGRPRDAIGRRIAGNEQRLETMEGTMGEIRDSLGDIATLLNSTQPATAPPPAASPGAQPIFDPTTGQWYMPSGAPPATPPEQTTEDAADVARKDYLYKAFDSLAYEFEHTLGLHRDDADGIAASVIEKHSKTGASVDSILSGMIDSNEDVRKLVLRKTEATALHLGGTFSMPEVVPVLNADGTPAVVPASAPGQEGTALVVPAPATSPTVAEPQSVVPAVEGGASVTPTTPPPDVNGADNDIAALVENANHESDSKFIVGV